VLGENAYRIPDAVFQWWQHVSRSRSIIVHVRINEITRIVRRLLANIRRF
jgi:hypothetical protein